MKPHHFILAVVPDTGRLHTLHGISFYNQFFLLDTLIKDLNMCVLCPTEYTKLIYWKTFWSEAWEEIIAIVQSNYFFLSASIYKVGMSIQGRHVTLKGRATWNIITRGNSWNCVRQPSARAPRAWVTLSRPSAPWCFWLPSPLTKILEDSGCAQGLNSMRATFGELWSGGLSR